MSCISFTSLCPSSGDTEQVLLSKILQSLNESGGGGVAGVTSLNVNGSGPQTGAVSITIPAATTPLLNFQDQNAGGDGVVYSDSGTNEVFRTEAGTDNVQFAGAAARIHSSAITDSFTFLATPAKADGGFIEVYGTGHPTGLGGATVSIHDGGQYRIRSAPVASSVSALRSTLDGTTGFLGVGASETPGGLLHLNSNTTAQLFILEQASGDASGFTFSFDKTRGTIAAPTVITVGDVEGTIRWRGYSGAGGYVTSASIRAVSTGTVASTRVAGNLVFSTATDAAPSVLTDVMFLFPGAGNVAFGGGGIGWGVAITSGRLSLGRPDGGGGVAAGTVVMEWFNNQANLAVGGFLAIGTSFISADTILNRDAAGVLALSNTTVAPQTFRITETTDAGLANYRRLSFQTQAGNHLIRTEAAGTGLTAGQPQILQVGTGPSVGTDIAGQSVLWHSGQGTGTGTGGSHLFQVSAPGATSATVQALATRLTLDTTDLTMATAVRLAVATGGNQRAGNATLIAGSVTVANTTVTANTIVLYSRKTSGGTIGTAMTYTVSAATSFTLTSDSALDTSTFSYFLIEVP